MKIALLLTSTLLIAVNYSFGHAIDNRQCGKVPSGSKDVWPWKATLFVSEPGDQKFRCGGTLISKDYVLTSARCVTIPGTKIPFAPYNLLIYLGGSKIHHNKLTGKHLQVLTPSEIIVNKHYNPDNTANDIALLKLEESAELNDYVNPICLWEGDRNATSVVGKVGVISAYDFTDGLFQLEESESTVVPIEKCFHAHPAFLVFLSVSNAICAGNKLGGVRTCPGQTGAGLYFQKPEDNNVWQLRAFKSTALYHHGVGAPCNTTDYVLYTDAAQYLDWINSKTGIGPNTSNGPSDTKKIPFDERIGDQTRSSGVLDDLDDIKAEIKKDLKDFRDKITSGRRTQVEAV